MNFVLGNTLKALIFQRFRQSKNVFVLQVFDFQTIVIVQNPRIFGRQTVYLEIREF